MTPQPRRSGVEHLAAITPRPAAYGPLNPVLVRALGGYWTEDHRFWIAPRGRKWTVAPKADEAQAWLYAADMLGVEYGTQREAVERLIGSVYAEPHGWAHHSAEAQELFRNAHHAR